MDQVPFQSPPYSVDLHLLSSLLSQLISPHVFCVAHRPCYSPATVLLPNRDHPHATHRLTTPERVINNQRDGLDKPSIESGSCFSLADLSDSELISHSGTGS
jgi:hypothetical protein